ncbi:MAG: hypothetical protein IJ752_00310 [Alphaproteobacteria bacterium]|nr:hypothetical protein [Alphaproteobacteria bacterium]
MNIDFILDISCLWSYISWRQLQTALKECAVQVDISPFFISSGSFFPGLDTEPADRARLLESRAGPLLKQTGIFVNFDCLPPLSHDLSWPDKLIRAAFAQKKYSVLDEVFSAFFSFGRDISALQTIIPIMEYHDLTLNDLNAVPPVSKIPVNMPEGLRAVPCLVFEHKTIIFGVQSVPCLKNMLHLAEQLKKEASFNKINS